MASTAPQRRDDVFVDDHGVTIHSSTWPARDPKAVVQIVHGVGEYALRYEPLARDLVANRYTVVAGDLRGHGRTGLGQWAGDHSRLGRLGPGGVRAAIAGVRQLGRMAKQAHPGLPLVLLGHSLGSMFAQMMIDADPGPYDAVVLSGTPYRTLRHMNSGDLNKPYRKHPGATGSEWLSRDPAVRAAFDRDPLTFDAKVAKLFGIRESLRLLGTPKRMRRDIPMLIQIGSEDTLTSPRGVDLLARAYRRAGLSDVEVRVYPGARHEVYNETNRDEVVADLVGWLDARL